MNTISRFLLDSARYLELDPALALRLLCEMKQRPITRDNYRRLPLCA